MNYKRLFASRTQNIKASAIRELLKVAAKPGMISFGGGLPAPESFPLHMLPDLTQKVIESYGPKAFQYDPTEGFGPLREALVDYCKKKGVSAEMKDIFITTGSQGFLDSIGKVFIGKGECVAVEAPTYLGALQAFNAYEPTYIRMKTDDDGVIPESMEEVLKGHEIKFIYLVPTFQNPTGRTITLERRKQIARIIQEHDALLIEDDPYSALRFRGEPVPTIKSMAPDHVVYASTISKVFAPGLRVGFFVAPEAVSKWMVLAKQGVDLHTSTYAQALAAVYLNGGYIEEQVPKIIGIYKPRQEAMLNALDEHFPKSFKYSRPDGGMFIWAEGPEGSDMEAVYHKAVAKGVAYVPGKAFFTEEGEGIETVRLNYTMINEETIVRGVKILSEVIEQEIR